jgi:hypothetical protein
MQTTLVTPTLCGGCLKPVVGPPLLVLTNEITGALEGEFHSSSCLARYVSERMMAEAGKKAAAEAGPEAVKVNKTNIKKALKTLTEGNTDGVGVATRLAEMGVKGICSQASLCPIAMYLTSYFGSFSFVTHSWVGVAKKPINEDPREFEPTFPMPDWNRQGDTGFVWIETPDVLSEFINDFDQGRGNEFCSLAVEDEDEDAWVEHWKSVTGLTFERDEDHEYA